MIIFPGEATFSRVTQVCCLLYMLLARLADTGDEHY